MLEAVGARVGRIQPGVQRGGSLLVFERESKRRRNFRNRSRIHQLERLAGVIQIFLQHPTGDHPASVGEADAIELGVDSEFLLRQ